MGIWVALLWCGCSVTVCCTQHRARRPRNELCSTMSLNVDNILPAADAENTWEKSWKR